MIESLYDEDLTENKFFQEFKVLYKHLVDQATSEGWIICVPKTGSFENACLTEDDYLYHVLVPSEELPASHYETLNKKKVNVSNKVITVEDDLVPLSTSILFEETFYMDDLRKFKVWCVECLLNQNYKSKFNNNSVLSLRDCIDFLWRESLGKEILEQLDDTINDFLVKQPALYEFSLTMQRELVNTLYTQCLKIALSDTRLRDNISKNKHNLNNLNISVEAYMQHNLYKILFSSILVSTAFEDASFNKIVRNLSDIQLRDLDIMPDVHDAIPCAKHQLAKINGFSTVLGKISCLRHTVSEISQSSYKSLSVDDLLPVLVFLILKSCIPNWITNLYFLKEYQFNYLSTGDESNFLITTLEAAIEYIKSGILSQESSNKINNDTDTNSTQYLFEQIKQGNYEDVKAILETNNVPNDFEMKSKELCHPLCSCDKCEKIITQIMSNSAPTVHSCDEKGNTALHIACMHGHPKIVELLLKYQSNIERCDYSGGTPLHYAAMRGHQNVLLLLLHSGANVNAVDNEKNTPLHYSCNNGHVACVNALVYFAEHQKIVLDINSKNLVGDTALHHAARWGYETIVHILLDHSADPNIENKLKKTACDYAHNLKIYQAILQSRCTYKQSDESVSLETSTDSKDFDLVEDFKEERATKPCSPQEMKKAELLLRAVAYDDIPMICYYLGLQVPDTHASNELCHPLCDCEKCEILPIGPNISPKDKLDINTCNSEGYTALHVASLHGQTEIVHLLLKNGALPNVITNKGLTALHLACQTERSVIVTLLLDCDDCKVNLQDMKGNTALHYACISRNLEIIQTLIEHEADIFLRNSHGKTPLEESDSKVSEFITNLESKK